MKLIPLIILSVNLLLMHTSCQDRPETTSSRILVFSKTDGWRHDSIEPAIEAITAMGRENDIIAEASEDAGIFTVDDLARFDAIVFLNTSGTIFTDDQRAAFRRYIKNGGGFVGIHGATDTEYDWEWYNRLVGAYFESHPNNPNVRDAVLQIVDSSHPATAHLPIRWEWTDEWYNFSDMNDSVNVLITIDTDSYEGSAHPGNHPIAWYHEYDGGRAFYTGLGHPIESFSDDLFLQHILGGIQYAVGGRNY